MHPRYVRSCYNFIFNLLLIPTKLIQAQDICSNPNEFLCPSGECITKEYLCNGFKECADGSDETSELCLNRSCSQSLDYTSGDQDDIFVIALSGQGQVFKCGYDACISSRFVCDGIRHCSDGSDEKEKLCKSQVCSSKQFKCSYGACIPKRNACDNRHHCSDESDETIEACQWKNSLCPSRKFKCSNGACIQMSKKCDSVIDCLDQSDESEATCGSRPNIVIRFSNLTIRELPKQQPTTENITDNPVSLVQLNSTISKEVNKNGCILTDGFVALEILECGDESDCNDQVLPFGTVMKITCGAITDLLQCKSDFLWHFVRDKLKAPKVNPCSYGGSNDPSSLVSENPPVQPTPTGCGIVPLLSPIPWLVGLFHRGNFSCTGTVIGPTLVLTAGHCVAENQASRTKIIDPSEIKIQVNSPNPDDEKQFASVSLIKHHPNYIGGTSPRSDIALLFLKENLELKYGLSSACIDQQGKILNIPAYTFNRTVGQTCYRWSNFPQNLDTTCVNKASMCSRHLNIGDNQFCAINKDSSLYLQEGSSGGPYIINLKEAGEDKWTVAGIVSSSIRTSSCGTPRTLFTSVSKFHNWIINCGFHGDCKA